MSRQLKRLVLILVAVVVVEYLVLPQIAGARRSIHLLRDVNPAWLAVGVILAGAAIVAYAQLTRAMLPPGDRVGLATTLRITLSTLGISHVVPGGTAAGATLGYRLLTEAGVNGTDASFALATQGVGSALVLNVILWIGLVVSIPLRGFNPLYGTAAVLGTLLIAAFATAVLLLTKGENRVANVVCRLADPLPFVEAASVERFLRRWADRLRGLAENRPVLQRAVGWAAANWLLDAAALWVFVAAYGHVIPPDGLLVAYGLAYVLAVIPVTPSGLGVVEATLTSMLVGFGAARGEAILGVLSYRLVNFWLPIPLGGLSYVSLKVGSRASRAEKADALRAAAEESLEVKRR